MIKIITKAGIQKGNRMDIHDKSNSLFTIFYMLIASPDDSIAFADTLVEYNIQSE